MTRINTGACSGREQPPRARETMGQFWFWIGRRPDKNDPKVTMWKQAAVLYHRDMSSGPASKSREPAGLVQTSVNVSNHDAPIVANMDRYKKQDTIRGNIPKPFLMVLDLVVLQNLDLPAATNEIFKDRYAEPAKNSKLVSNVTYSLELALQHLVEEIYHLPSPKSVISSTSD